MSQSIKKLMLNGGTFTRFNNLHAVNPLPPPNLLLHVAKDLQR